MQMHANLILMYPQHMRLYVILMLIFMPSQHTRLPGNSAGKESACMQETLVQLLGWEDPLEKGMATHSSILAWRIPQTV